MFPMNAIQSAQSAHAFPESGLPERLGPPPTLDPQQQAAADSLINGPRGGVYGPFRPLLHAPSLLDAVAHVGETLRYRGTLDAALREWTICVVSRELSNVFEWDMHLPLAVAAGVPADALAAVADGRQSPGSLRTDLALSRQLAQELTSQHRVADATYARAIAEWGEAKLVELLTLVGYFSMVCWLMNVARTPPRAA
jgi:4-carboxymuconolactone decarboxylase